MKRSPLRRKTGLRPRGNTAYARRSRAFDYMGWVKSLACLLARAGGCAGGVEADHCGDRGIGQKSKDRDCVPLCRQHHRERTDMSGIFAGYDAAAMRAWRHMAINVTHDLAARCGVTVPDC